MYENFVWTVKNILQQTFLIIMYTHGKRLNLLTGILCMVLVVMIAISESESMSLNEHSSDDEIEDEVSFFVIYIVYIYKLPNHPL